MPTGSISSDNDAVTTKYSSAANAAQIADENPPLIDSKTFDPASNFLGRHPKITAAGCAALGTALAANLVRCAQSSSGVLTIPFLLKVSTTLGLFSSAHAFAFDYKPKTSRFPFGHTSSKEVIAGSTMFGSGLLLAYNMLLAYRSQSDIHKDSPAYFWLSMTMNLFCAGLLTYTGGKLIADGFSWRTSIKSNKLPGVAYKNTLRIPDQPTCLKVQAASSLDASFGNASHRIWRIPHLLNAAAIMDPNLKTIDTTQIFKDGTVAFCFGKPNVFLMRIEGGVTQRVDAKSLWREVTKITTSDDKGKVQSGLFLVPRNLKSEIMKKLEQAAQEAVNTSRSTCAQTNTLILEKAGFSFGNGTSINVTLPHVLLNNILHYGLVCAGEKVEFDIICTTANNNLQEFYADLTSAEFNAPCRHTNRKAAAQDDEGRRQRASEAQTIHETNERMLRPAGEREPVADLFAVWGSQPSQLGTFARTVWGPHAVYRIKFSEKVNIDSFLPNLLYAFPQTKPSSLTLIKRDVIFCPSSLNYICKNMASSFKLIDYFYGTRLLELLKDGEKRNFVLTEDELVLVRLGKSNSHVDWALSKHVLAASAAGNACPKDGRGFPMVRFAGELRYDDQSNTLFINANSGTYMPTSAHLNNAERLAKLMFPEVNIVAEASHEECFRP